MFSSSQKMKIYCTTTSFIQRTSQVFFRAKVDVNEQRLCRPVFPNVFWHVAPFSDFIFGVAPSNICWKKITPAVLHLDGGYVTSGAQTFGRQVPAGCCRVGARGASWIDNFRAISMLRLGARWRDRPKVYRPTR